MNHCEQYQMHISSLIDGELERRGYLELMEHVLGCPRCTRFFRDARQLQKLIDETAPDLQPARESGVETDEPLERRSSGHKRWARLFPIPAWGWAAAVVFTAAATLWQVLPDHGPPKTAHVAPEGSRDADLTIVLERDPDQMTEDRFLSLTVELLQSDERYQMKMAEVLHAATNARTTRPAGAL